DTREAVWNPLPFRRGHRMWHGPLRLLPESVLAGAGVRRGPLAGDAAGRSRPLPRLQCVLAASGPPPAPPATPRRPRHGEPRYPEPSGGRLRPLPCLPPCREQPPKRRPSSVRPGDPLRSAARPPPLHTPASLASPRLRAADHLGPAGPAAFDPRTPARARIARVNGRAAS